MMNMKCFRNLIDPRDSCTNCVFRGGMSGPIQQQFTMWGLSKSESEIALLLLKGFALREIATLRNTTEATVRQQSLQIYQKAHVDGRPQLAGYFIERLMNICSESE
ncbi:Bacterial regulatory protein, luxR family [compost metagenome]